MTTTSHVSDEYDDLIAELETTSYALAVTDTGNADIISRTAAALKSASEQLAELRNYVAVENSFSGINGAPATDDWRAGFYDGFYADKGVQL